MHVRRQSDEEPPVIRREVTSEMVSARNRAPDEVLAQISGPKCCLTADSATSHADSLGNFFVMRAEQLHEPWLC